MRKLWIVVVAACAGGSGGGGSKPRTPGIEVASLPCPESADTAMKSTPVAGKAGAIVFNNRAAQERQLWLQSPEGKGDVVATLKPGQGTEVKGPQGSTYLVKDAATCLLVVMMAPGTNHLNVR